jgi:hypothetical protein
MAHLTVTGDDVALRASGASASGCGLDLDGVRPDGVAYAFDPLFWPRLCAGDVSAWRGAIAEASRSNVILVPALVSGDRHWLLLVVRRDDRAVECYDSLRNNGRCRRALETVESALVRGELQRHYWASADPETGTAASAASLATSVAAAVVSGGSRPNDCTDCDTSTSTSTSTNVLEASDNVCSGASAAGNVANADADADAAVAATEWRLRIVDCAQQPNHDDCGPYMLWFARRILLLGAAHAAHAAAAREPPPPDWRMQIVRELSAQLDAGSAQPVSAAAAAAATAAAAAVPADAQDANEIGSAAAASCR